MANDPQQSALVEYIRSAESVTIVCRHPSSKDSPRVTLSPPLNRQHRVAQGAHEAARRRNRDILHTTPNQTAKQTAHTSMKATTTKPNTARAFAKGMRELRFKDMAAARADLMTALGINNQQSLRNYAKGLVKNLDVDKAAKVQAVFAKYGVREPWGI